MPGVRILLNKPTIHRVNNKADLFWNNQTNGLLAVWFMCGLIISSVGFPGKLRQIWK